MKLEEVYNAIPKSTCPPGCGKCCGILYPSLAEIAQIKEWLKERNRPFIEFHMMVGIDCPYLDKTKGCSIYPVRPYLCRILGVAVDCQCPTRECKPSKMLNLAVSSHLYSEVYLKGKEKLRTEKHRAELIKLLKDNGLDPQKLKADLNRRIKSPK